MGNPLPTRTLNPLPFHDLEPHRFEDLVRALAYGFRNWASLEATGRSGADEGIDILGTELAIEVSPHVVPDEPADDEESDPTIPTISSTRRWIFQCKREKSFGPKDVKKAVAESLDGVPAPHGFVLAAACDISTKTRDAFRAEMVKRGVQEFYMWSRGELEDMLFQAQHDRVLFGFFGISLQPRRQAALASLRSSIVLKKRLKTALTSDEDDDNKLVLLRDPLDDRYPARVKDARWMLCEFRGATFPGGIRVLQSEHYAWIRPRDDAWDAVLEYDCGAWQRLQRATHPDGRRSWAAEEAEEYVAHPSHAFWSEHVPQNERAYLHVMRLVPYARVVAFDPIGDGYYPVPQIFVEWDPTHGPFDEKQWRWLQVSHRGGYGHVALLPSKENRAKLFPAPIPPNIYPPPLGFEHVVQGRQLSKATDARLAEVLAGAKRPMPQTETPSAEVHAPASSSNRDAFLKWRDDVAAPVLSTFVERLRAGGHEAWVSVASSSQDKGGHQWSEEIELHVRAGFSPYPHNPDHRPSGHARFVAAAYPAFEVEIEPFQDPDAVPAPTTSYGSRPRAERPKPQLDDFVQDRLERDVAIMIERLFAKHEPY